MAFIGDIVAYLRMDSKNFTKNARAASQQTKTLGAGFGRMAMSAGKGGLALAGVGSVTAGAFSAITNTVGFDRAMARSLAIQDVTADTQKRMREEARKTSAATQFSATEAAEAYYFLASAGLSAEEQLDSMSTVAKFAQAGNFDLARATDLVTDAQSALGLSSGTAGQKLQNMTKVAGTLIQANTIANASVEQFSESLTNQAAVMGTQYGESIAEILAVMSVFADKGFAKGAEAGTKYGMVLRDLTSKAITSSDALKQAGIEIFSTEGKFLGVRNAVEQLTNKLGGLDDRAKKTALQELGFTDKSQAGLSALIGTTEQLNVSVNKLGMSWQDAGIILDSVADKSITKFDKQLSKLNAQWERFSANTVGPAVEFGVTPLLDGTNQWIDLTVSGTKQWYDVLTEGWKMTGRAMEAALIGNNPIKAAAGVAQAEDQTTLMSSEERAKQIEAGKARRVFMEQSIERDRINNAAPFGSALPGLGDVFRGGVSPIGTDGASLGDGSGAATVQALTTQNDLLTEQLQELKKLNSDTETI